MHACTTLINSFGAGYKFSTFFNIVGTQDGLACAEKIDVQKDKYRLIKTVDKENSRMGTFSDEVVRAALDRAGGRCECNRTNSDCLKKHSYFSCNESGFTMQNRGTRWETHHKTSQEAGGDDTLSNCEILCLDCHKATRTYGG